MAPFGERLKKEREQKKISLDDVSAATKVSTRFLRAIETDQFDQLPGGIFNKGFIRAYARHLGIDEDQAIADYMEATGENRPAAENPQAEAFPLRLSEEKMRQAQTAARVPWELMAIVLLVVSSGFAIWGVYSRDKKSGSTMGNAGRETQSPPGASMPAAETDSAEGPKSTVVPASEKRISASPSDAPPPTATPQSSVTPGQSQGTGFTVKVTAQEDCWISINADGQPVMQDTLAASTQKSVEAQREIVIRAGNIGALNLSFNGKPLPAQGDYGEVKTLTFDRNGLQAAVSKPPS